MPLSPEDIRKKQDLNRERAISRASSLIDEILDGAATRIIEHGEIDVLVNATDDSEFPAIQEAIPELYRAKGWTAVKIWFKQHVPYLHLELPKGDKSNEVDQQ